MKGSKMLRRKESAKKRRKTFGKTVSRTRSENMRSKPQRGGWRL